MGRKTTHILLVEDEEAHGELIRRAFETQAEGVTLTVVRTLREARATLAESTPDLVIADIRLPDGNGLEILPPEKEGVCFPVVVLTGHGDERAAVEAMKRGALDYVVKSEATLANTPHITSRTLREWGHITARKRAEDALRRSENELRVIAENVPALLSYVDTEGFYRFVNKRYEEWFGCSRAEITGKHYRHVLGEATYQKIRTRVDAALSGQHITYEDVLPYAHGGPRWVIADYVPDIDTSGDVHGLFALVTDITDRKQAEQALRESEEKFRGITERSYDGVLTLDLEGKITYVSPAVERIGGYKPDEVLGRHFQEFFMEAELSKLAQAFDEAMQGRVVENLQLDGKKKDGSLCILECNGSPVLQNGRVVGAQAVFREITQRRKAEEALKKAHDELEARVQERTAELAAANRKLQDEIAERKRAEDALRKQNQLINGILRNLPVLAFMLDNDGRFEEMGGAALERFGRTGAESIGKSAVHAYSQGREWIQRALSGESVHFESQGTLDGKPFAFDTFIAFDKVRGSGAVGFAIDITQRRLAEQREEKLRAELAHMARVETMGEMANGIAHELNQPLAVIVARTEAAAQKLRLGKQGTKQQQIQQLEDIANEAYRAGQIIRRMRDFIRKVEPRRSTIDVAELIDEVVALVQSDLRHAGITLRCDVGPSLPKIVADKIQVQQVLLNLMRNAMEAMDRSGPDSHELSIRATAGENALQIAVCDTGCGIPNASLEHVFETYCSTKPGGLGMGLRISRSIIEAHGGHISAARNPQRGSTFTFTLPIATPH